MTYFSSCFNLTDILYETKLIKTFNVVYLIHKKKLSNSNSFLVSLSGKSQQIRLNLNKNMQI